MIEMLHVTPLVAPKTGERSLWIATITPETNQYSGLSIAPIYFAPLKPLIDGAFLTDNEKNVRFSGT